jgi:hypothetical protein
MLWATEFEEVSMRWSTIDNAGNRCIMATAVYVPKEMKSLFAMISFSLEIFRHGYKCQAGYGLASSVGHREF